MDALWHFTARCTIMYSVPKHRSSSETTSGSRTVLVTSGICVSLWLLSIWLLQAPLWFRRAEAHGRPCGSRKANTFVPIRSPMRARQLLDWRRSSGTVDSGLVPTGRRRSRNVFTNFKVRVRASEREGAAAVESTRGTLICGQGINERRARSAIDWNISQCFVSPRCKRGRA
ncbi:hypothetical protein H4582DRAFT_277736 [Lactarius indigo]|nr:hypothetical protein H4582DRAFT_277736 [Lactarius indigo]